LHAAGALNGGLYFKMLDDAAFFAANSLVRETFVLTSNFTIHLFRSISGGITCSVESLAFSKRSSFVAEARLYLEDGKEAAMGSGTFVKGATPLATIPGYEKS